MQVTERDLGFALLGALVLGLFVLGLVWLREGLSWTAGLGALGVGVLQLALRALEWGYRAGRAASGGGRERSAR